MLGTACALGTNNTSDVSRRENSNVVRRKLSILMFMCGTSVSTHKFFFQTCATAGDTRRSRRVALLGRFLGQFVVNGRERKVLLGSCLVVLLERRTVPRYS